MSPELNSILCEVVKIVNHVKANALNCRLFTALCEDAGSEHRQFILHADMPWLCGGKVLSRIAKYELAHFI